MWTHPDILAMLRDEGRRVYGMRQRYLTLPYPPSDSDETSDAWRKIDAAYDAWTEAATELAGSIRRLGVSVWDLDDITRDALTEPQR